MRGVAPVPRRTRVAALNSARGAPFARRTVMTEPAVNFSSAQILEEQSPYAPPLENPLPRAVTRRNYYELLDGVWRFELDLEDVGLREGGAIQHEFTDTATWPGSRACTAAAGAALEGQGHRLVRARFHPS